MYCLFGPRRCAALCNEFVLVFLPSGCVLPALLVSILHNFTELLFLPLCCLFVYLLGSCGRLQSTTNFNSTGFHANFIFQIITVVTTRVFIEYSTFELYCFFWQQQQLIFRSIPFSVRLLDVQAGRLVCLAEMSWKSEKGKIREKEKGKKN